MKLTKYSIYYLPSYVTLFILAILFYYFNITDFLFVWMVPDEIQVTDQISAGIWSCAKHYYHNTTINRLSADFGVCSFAKIGKLFSSPYIGWISARGISYFTILLSLTLTIKKITKCTFLYSFCVASIVSGIGFYMIVTGYDYLYGLDLAIYALAISSYFLLIALFDDCCKSNIRFGIFCLVYFINLNSQEIFLVIGSIYIPMFVWYQYKNITLENSHFRLKILNYILKDKRVIFLFIIYLASALFTILAPGTEMRQQVWPSTGSISDGLSYIVLAMEETASTLSSHYVLLSILFLLGISFNLSFKKIQITHRLLYIFVLSSPLLYLCVAAFLLGVTPSLWVGKGRAQTFSIFDQFISNRSIVNYGNLALRQNIFPYILFCFDFFLLGFMLNIKSSLIKYFNSRSTAAAALIILLPLLIISHPNNLESMYVLYSNFEKDNSYINYESHLNYRDKLGVFNNLKKALFPTKLSIHFQWILKNLAIDSVLQCRKNNSVPTAVSILQPIHYVRSDDTVLDGWRSPILAQYGLVVKEDEHKGE